MTQTITPDLQQWILEQTACGHPPEVVLQAMVQAGWTTGVARRALEDTLHRHSRKQLQEQPQQQPLAASAGAAGLAVEGGARLPDVDGSTASREIDAGDRQVQLIASLRSPRLLVLGGLLSHEECDALIEAARPRLARSLTVQTQTGGEELNPHRTSSGMFFQRGESELLLRVEARIARLLRWPVENGEGLQVLHYRPGAEYKPHYDYFDPGEPGTAKVLQRGGQRVATLLMYLNEPEQGGATTFPDVGLEVAPLRGNAVFFSYDRPSPATRTLHGGAPVLSGEKWVATKWLRERQFN